MAFWGGKGFGKLVKSGIIGGKGFGKLVKSGIFVAKVLDSSEKVPFLATVLESLEILW